MSSPHGAYAYKMKNSCIEFDEKMYDDPVERVLDVMANTPDRINMLYIEFQYYQIGESDAWLESARKLSTNPISFRREFLLEWINTNGKSPFDPDDVDYIMRISNERYKNNFKEITVNKYFKLKVYGEYKGNRPVLISVDVSSGGGRDASAVVVVNPENLKPLAFFKSNMISTYHLKRFLIALVQKLYPNSILTVEKNYLGDAILNELAETPIRKNLYKERKKVKVETYQSGFSQKHTIDDIVYGHRVDSSSRPKMMEMLESMVKNSKEYLAFPELVEEIQHLELKNGRIDHGNASHDDCIFAYFGALYVVKYGTGLKNTGIYFNIGLDADDEVHHSVRDNLRLLDMAYDRNQIEGNNIAQQVRTLSAFLNTPQPVIAGGEYLDNWNRKQDERRNGYIDEDNNSEFEQKNNSRLNKILSANLGYTLQQNFSDVDRGFNSKASEEEFENSQKSSWFNRMRGGQ